MPAVVSDPRRLLLTSTAARCRLDAARSWLAARQGGELLVLAPSRAAGDQLLRELAGSAGLLGPHRFTLPQLAAELALAPLALRRLTTATGLAREALAARAIARAADLPYFAPVAQMPGFPRAAAATLAELRGNEVEVEALAACGLPGADLAELLRCYREELERRQLVDDSALYQLAIEQTVSASHRLLDLPLLLLDLAPTLLVEQQLLRAVVSRSSEVLATAPAGGRESLAHLAAALGVEAADLDDSGVPGNRLERLRRYVFSSELPAVEVPADDSVLLLSAGGEGRECVEIARQLLDLAATGVPFDRVAVLLRDPERYLALLEEALSRAEIPAYFCRGTMRPDPAGRAFLALLSCAAEGLSASRFAEYLSLGEVPAVDGAGAPPDVEVPWVEARGEQLALTSPATSPMAPTDPAAEELSADETDESPVLAGTLRAPRDWERLLVDAAVVGGRDRWARRLTGLEAELRCRAEELGGENEATAGRLHRDLASLERLERFALPLIDLLAELPANASWGVWLAALEGLAARALRRPGSVLSLLAELRPMESVGPIELEEARRVLTQRLTWLRDEPPTRSDGRVFVGTVAEARGRSFRVVFVPGLAEGIFPRKTLEDPLLLDHYRQRLAAPLATQRERVERERLLLRIACGAAEERLVLSFPRVDVLQGRPRVPSFYALDLLRAAEGSLPELAEVTRRAAAGSAGLLAWPAPALPEQAIDLQEHDVSHLARLLGGEVDEVRGRARFLLADSPCLDRSLRARWRRWTPRAFTPADGLIDPSAEAAALLAWHRLSRRPYSPTALQTWATCPYRFLLQAVHRLRPRQEAISIEQLDPLTRGSLFHEVQHELFGELREVALLPLSRDRLGPVLALADTVLERVASRFEDELAPAIPRVFRDEVEGIRIDLRGWLLRLSEEEGYEPLHSELAFGLAAEAGRDAASRPEPVAIGDDGFTLRGSIDLVEEHRETRQLRVTDHKTGRAPWERYLVVGKGEVLQPVLYGLVAERQLERPAAEGRLFFCTRRGGYEVRAVDLGTEQRERALEVLRRVDGAIADGFLPAAPREGACRFCDYRLVCGPWEEARTARKRSERLAPLLEVRSWD